MRSIAGRGPCRWQAGWSPADARRGRGRRPAYRPTERGQRSHQETSPEPPASSTGLQRWPGGRVEGMGEAAASKGLIFAARLDASAPNGRTAADRQGSAASSGARSPGRRSHPPDLGPKRRAPMAGPQWRGPSSGPQQWHPLNRGLPPWMRHRSATDWQRARPAHDSGPAPPIAAGTGLYWPITKAASLLPSGSRK